MRGTTPAPASGTGVPTPARRSGTIDAARKLPRASSFARSSALVPSDAVSAQRVRACEVPEAVGDQALPVPLDAAQDVRPGAEHEVGAGADHRVRERAAVPARLAEIGLGGSADVLRVRPLRSRVHVDDDDVGVARSVSHEARRSSDVEEALCPAVGRAADQRDPDVPQRHLEHLAGEPLLEETGVAK